MRPVTYKGFRLEVTRYEGWTMGSAIRVSDGWELVDECTEDMYMKYMMIDLKLYVDDFYVNPGDYDAPGWQGG